MLANIPLCGVLSSTTAVWIWPWKAVFGEEESWWAEERRRLPRAPIGASVVLFVIGCLIGLALLRTPVHIMLFATGMVHMAIAITVATLYAIGVLGERRPVAATALAVLMFTSYITGALLTWRSVGWRWANTYGQYVRYCGPGDVYVFPEIPPDELRVTTSEIAKSIAEMKKTAAASVVTSVHIGLYNGELCWIATLSEKPFLGMLVLRSNRIRELVVCLLYTSPSPRDRG